MREVVTLARQTLRSSLRALEAARAARAYAQDLASILSSDAMTPIRGRNPVLSGVALDAHRAALSADESAKVCGEAYHAARQVLDVLEEDHR